MSPDLSVNMSLTTLPTTSRVILSSDADWVTWLAQLQHHIGNRDFYTTYVDPNVTRTPPDIKQPEPPFRPSFNNAYNRAIAAWEALPEVGREERPRTEAYTLSNSEIAAFRDAWEQYKTIELREYEKNERLYRDTSDFINSTVNNLGKSLLKAEYDLRTQVQVLKQRFGRRVGDALRISRKAYKDALAAPFPSTKAACRNWLSNWETAFVRASEDKVPETANSEIWIMDLVSALGPKAPSFRSQVLAGQFNEGTSDKQTPDITERDVVAAIYREWELSPELFMSQTRAPRGSALAAISQVAEGKPGQLPPSPGLKRSGSSTNGPSRDGVQTKRLRRHCIGCLGGSHEIENCFLAFPGHPNKPDDFDATLNTPLVQKRIATWNINKQIPAVAKAVRDHGQKTGFRHSLNEKYEINA
jgi:hypothetical protein